MISYLRGSVKHISAVPKKDNFIILDVGGVGYKVFVTSRLIADLSDAQETEVYVYTQVAETALSLYGFPKMEELGFFELLLTISGVGPKSALNILQKAKIEDLKAAASGGSADVLSQISGIGVKTAEKIVTGLKDKIGSIESVDSVGWDDAFSESMEALISLGYNATQSREALLSIKVPDTAGKIKEALKLLGKN
jgi:Holliday junction DNA helicase RuvA